MAESAFPLDEETFGGLRLFVSQNVVNSVGYVVFIAVMLSILILSMVLVINNSIQQGRNIFLELLLGFLRINFEEQLPMVVVLQPRTIRRTLCVLLTVQFW